MVCSRGGLTLTIHIIQMKLFTSIAAAAVVIGGSLIATAPPASAQYYGGSYGYNNGRPNSYGDFGTYNKAPRYGSPAYGSSYGYRSQRRMNPNRNSGCSTLSMDSTCW